MELNLKFSMQEEIVKAKVAQVVEEEQAAEKADPSIAELKEQTNALLAQQDALRAVGDEEARREIRNEIVVLNMRLVTHIAGKYGFFSPDRFQNGCIGLLKAVETFQLEKGVPFSNYAAYCIENEVRVAWGKNNRMFESRNKGFLESLDEPMNLGNGDQLDKGEMIEDTLSSDMFAALVEEAEMDTIIYGIVLPCIEEYGTRSRGVDVAAWRDLQLQYFLELSVESSRVQRLTFTRMAELLGTTPQNLRTRHKRVVELIKERCLDFGYRIGEHGGIYFDYAD